MGDSSWGERKSMKYNEEEEEEDEEYQDEDEGKKKRVVVVSNKRASSSSCTCQVDGCNADLSIAKQYHKRHKVCEYHAKAHSVLISQQHQRFCQQCSRFHELSEFDDSKRSCRRRLAGHNERRRKNSSDCQG
ncbi:hypothetical protein HN51_030345 [Arachis hypogaea]|uniref:SBP-type domain-containing protein n=2 Tax=Arachis TaxID=3817 RepID=A0A445BBJ7_ARAHY|nr:squamosa promoter-binding-like protein 3 [Arachis duranensis]XP_025625799.1 squamosa promoter-binding-like protein 3 [Arachis hypogaea]XP_057740754.1 squamosa promoter-binding-like protein 3 [Arachis stenosperma]QHO14821.1 Squamosa promoter-binding protein [Arachis hypogaea]RYR36044.1 hypothetical protein Ahy_A10g051104 [Arachis hypogaea]